MPRTPIGPRPLIAKTQKPPKTDTLVRIAELQQREPALYGLIGGFDGWRARFLVALAMRGNIAYACRVAGVGRQAATENKLRNPQFEQAWNLALQTAVDKVEEAAWDLALGSDTYAPDKTMIQFMLKHHKADTYGDKRTVEHTGPGGGAIPVATQEQLGSQKQLAEVLAVLIQAKAVEAPPDFIEGEFVDDHANELKVQDATLYH